MHVPGYPVIRRKTKLHLAWGRYGIVLAERENDALEGAFEGHLGAIGKDDLLPACGV